jgi:dephospho-CoA kinase
MLNLIKIAVTGPISSGKSTACELLAKHKAYVMSADDVVHKLLQSNINIQNQIIQLLNKKISFADLSYRKQIADAIFNDYDLLDKYEKLLHPLVIEAIKEGYHKCLESGSYKMFVCEVPLLFETKMDTLFDKILYVQADSNTCIERFIKKTPYKAPEWHRRMNRFDSEPLKKNNSFFTIVNNGNIKELSQQIDNFLNSQAN